MTVLGETEQQRQQRLKRRRERPGHRAYKAAKAFFQSCTGEEAIAFSPAPNGKTPWWRFHEKGPTDGAEFDRLVLQVCLPAASLHAILAAAKEYGWDADDVYGHLGWAFSRGYITVNGKLAEQRVDP